MYTGRNTTITVVRETKTLFICEEPLSNGNVREYRIRKRDGHIQNLSHEMITIKASLDAYKASLADDIPPVPNKPAMTLGGLIEPITQSDLDSIRINNLKPKVEKVFPITPREQAINPVLPAEGFHLLHGKLFKVSHMPDKTLDYVHVLKFNHAGEIRSTHYNIDRFANLVAIPEKFTISCNTIIETGRFLEEYIDGIKARDLTAAQALQQEKIGARILEKETQLKVAVLLDLQITELMHIFGGVDKAQGDNIAAAVCALASELNIAYSALLGC